MANKKAFGKIKGREAMVLGIIIVMVVLFSLLSPTFRTYPTLVSVLDNSYYIALMALGVTFPLITGGVDLSIGTGLVSYALIGGYLIIHQGTSVGVGILACIGIGVLIGAFNGALIAIMDLPPFLATLCTCMITRGLGPALCGGFWCFLAVSHIRDGRIQKDIQVCYPGRDGGTDRNYPYRSSGNYYVLCIEPYESWALYDSNRE